MVQIINPFFNIVNNQTRPRKHRFCRVNKPKTKPEIKISKIAFKNRTCTALFYSCFRWTSQFSGRTKFRVLMHKNPYWFLYKRARSDIRVNVKSLELTRSLLNLFGVKVRTWLTKKKLIIFYDEWAMSFVIARDRHGIGFDQPSQRGFPDDFPVARSVVERGKCLTFNNVWKKKNKNKI